MILSSLCILEAVNFLLHMVVWLVSLLGRPLIWRPYFDFVTPYSGLSVSLDSFLCSPTNDTRLRCRIALPNTVRVSVTWPWDNTHWSQYIYWKQDLRLQELAQLLYLDYMYGTGPFNTRHSSFYPQFSFNSIQLTSVQIKSSPVHATVSDLSLLIDF